MEPELAALATTAGSTLVTLVATDAWQRMRDGVVSLWQRARPGSATGIADDLDATRLELLGARAEGDADSEAEVRVEWQGRIRRLLASHPELVDALRTLLEELAVEEETAGPAVSQHATASGSARVYQAGRDMRVGGSGADGA